MGAIHPPHRLRRCLPGKPDAATGFRLTVCGAAGLSGLILAVALVQAVIR